MDNARPHNSRRSQDCIASSRARRLPHPAYSPDLAPSDFFAFGYLKEKLMEFDCVSRDALKDAITQIFDAIDKEVPLSMFTSWIKRLKWVIQHQGEYYHES
jgi:histone-lysine N-methyltransferase SETMAR